MFAEIKLTISESGRVIETVTKETGTRPAQLAQSVDEFQQLANKAMTKIIENSEQSGADGNCMDLDDIEDDEDGEAKMTPRKKKK